MERAGVEEATGETEASCKKKSSSKEKRRWETGYRLSETSGEGGVQKKYGRPTDKTLSSIG